MKLVKDVCSKQKIVDKLTLVSIRVFKKTTENEPHMVIYFSDEKSGKNMFVGKLLSVDPQLETDEQKNAAKKKFNKDLLKQIYKVRELRVTKNYQ